MKNLPKIILTDIDGVWTDGGMYYDQFNNESKRFNTYDSAGVLFAHTLSIPIGIITGENTAIVQRRAEKLKIDYLYQGVKNKLKVVDEIIADLGITYHDVAYIGDDINDLQVLHKVGYSGAPSSSPAYIKSVVNYVTQQKGGDGAFREFVEHVIGEDRLHDIISKVVKESFEQ